MKNNIQKIILFVLVLIVVSLACSSNNNEPVLVESSNSSGEPSSGNNSVNTNDSTDEQTSAPQFFQVGDVIAYSDHEIAVTSAEFLSTMIKIDFIVHNTSGDSMSVSSLLSFSARNDDGTTLEQEIFDCGSGFDGTIPAGGVLQGSICWGGAVAPVKVYYEPSLLGSSTVWLIEETGASEVQFDSQIQGETFGVGDLLSFSDHTIMLESAQVVNGVLQASFIVENTGNEQMTISSMLSFSAQKVDGTKLDQEIFDCGSGLDGDIVVGDKLKGQICWSNAELPVNIFYEPSLFGSSLVIWQISE